MRRQTNLWGDVEANYAELQGGFVKRCTAHPEDAILESLLGELDARALLALSDHLSHCESCRTLEQEWREALRIASGGPTAGRSAGALGTPWRGLFERVRRPRTLGRLMRPGQGGDRNGATGWVVQHDPAMCEVVVRGLDPLPVGHVYVVWLDGSHGPRCVGAFAVDRTGAGRVELAGPIGTATLYVTAEAHANEVEPHGSVQLMVSLP